MVLHSFINAVLTFNIETLKRFGMFVSRYESEDGQISSRLLKSNLCNNVYMTSDYVNTPYVFNDTKFIVVKHILESSRNTQKGNILTEEAESTGIDSKNIKMIGFLSWFFTEAKNEYFSDVLDENDEDLKKKRTDLFSIKGFTIAELKNQIDNFKLNANLLYSQKQTYFDGLNSDEFLYRFFDTNNEFKTFTFGWLSEQLKEYGSIVIDLNNHLNNNEECVFAVYIQCQNKRVRISEYFYHSDDICYTNFGLNYLIVHGSVKMLKNLSSHKNMMNVTNYTLSHEHNFFQTIIDNFEQMHSVNISQKKLALKVNNGRKDPFRIIIKNKKSDWNTTADDW